MRTLTLAFLLGCTGDKGDPVDSPATGTGTDDTADSGDDTAEPVETWPQPAFEAPGEAEDLDPSETVVHYRLRAAPKAHSILDWQTGETFEIEGYAYNDALPGPTLRARVGDTVIVELQNDLDVPTTIHWHGMAVPFEMDGMTWMMDPVAPGGSFTYSFTATEAGTFWYHPHFDTVHQLDLGLYGVFVVEDPDEPAVDRDLVLIVDDWGESAETDVLPDAVHGAHGEIGRFAINGLVRPSLPVQGGESLRLRILNASNHGYLDLSLPGARILAEDQGLLPSPQALDTAVLGPGDRLELELLPGMDSPGLVDRPYSLNGGPALGEDIVLLDLPNEAPSSAASAPDWPLSLLSPGEDPGHTDILYVLQGEAHTDSWRINGEAFPDVTMEMLPLGQDAIIEVRNLSATEHPFHLHGMAFEVLSIDGNPPPWRRIEDTVNVRMHEAVRLRLVADNPGHWMAHCHILPHAEGGMMTMLGVE